MKEKKKQEPLITAYNHYSIHVIPERTEQTELNRKNSLTCQYQHFFHYKAIFGQLFNFFVHHSFFYKLPHQASRNLFNIRKCLIEEIQFHPENCTHPGEQVISYLINYWGLVSLPNCGHLIQYWNWKFKGECIRECFMDDEKSAKVKVLLHSEKKFLIFCLYFI